MENRDTDSDALMAAWLAGERVDEALLRLCRDDPALAQRLAGHVEVERLLRLHALCAEDDVFVQEVARRLQCEDGESFADTVAQRLRSDRRRIFLSRACAAAALLAAVLTGWFLLQSPLAVRAVVVQQRSAVCNGRTLPTGAEIRVRRVRLSEGYAELRLANGVHLVLEAPVDMEIKGRRGVALNSGRLVARVPEKATGFTVVTPSSEVVDLGTAFGVAVDDCGSSEICVLEGEIKARGCTTQEYVRMVQNEACSFDTHRQIRMIRSDPARFMRALPGRSADNPDYLHWSFDGDGAIAVCGGRGIRGRLYDGHLKSFGEGTGPLRQPGVFGKSLYFNGTDAYVETDFPGIGGSAPRTVAFWARVPEGAIRHSGYAMICWGLMAPGSAWQISANPFEPEGPPGRIRIGTKVGMVIGTRDLRDNRWHHIAIVMYGGEEADTSTHILVYVDGQLEKTSRKSIAEISTALDSGKSQRLRFGRNLGFRTGSEAIADKFFNGWLDEVYIFDAALEQDQIQRLIKTNEFNQ